MIIYRPVKTNFITQQFGENKLPIYKKVGMLGHNGLDFASYHGELLVWNCDLDGVVLNHHVDDAGGIGIDIIVKEGESIHKFRHWHLVKGAKRAEIGSTVKTGDFVGYADNTGYSTGNHDHFGLKPQTENYKNKFQNNGYYGAIDPMPFYTNIYAKDLKKIQGGINIVKEMLKKLIESIKELFKGR